MSRLIVALTRNRAETDPRSEDERLRGRTYAIPFDRVWKAALQLCDGGLPRWSLVGADDREGVIRAHVLPRFSRRPSTVRVKVGLDENGQTRVDVAAISQERKRDLGANARHIARFTDELDLRLNAQGREILDASRGPQFST